jgi:poly(3-hydroxyalkanoate) depolymerase
MPRSVASLTEQNRSSSGSGPEFFWRTIDGARLRVARWRPDSGRKDKLPLLLFTGIGASIELLAPFVARLEGREVVTFDIPGVGASPAWPRPYRLRTMAKLADRLLTSLGYDTVDVLGLSWGGMLAQQFAHQFGDRVGRLVLGATAPGATMFPGRPSALVKMLMPTRHHEAAYLDRHFETIYGGTRAGAEDLEIRMTQPSRRGYFHQLLAVTGWTSLPFLPRIKVPTLVVMGAADRLVPLANGYIFKLLMRDVRLEVIEDAGHMFALTHRNAFARLTGDFLDGRAAPKIDAVAMMKRAKLMPAR